MLTAEELGARREAVAASADLTELYGALKRRAAHWRADRPAVPRRKAILSTTGGVCPRDGSALRFDPRAGGAHVCPVCHERVSDQRHEDWWVRFQHLWMAERTAEQAAVGAIGEDREALAAAREVLEEYAGVYHALPNRDNVLGPTRLFFSTYLESIWLGNYLSAAVLLREMDALDDAASDAVSGVADAAAHLIGEFNEGLSNRQTWHAAALTAVAAWFGDEDLARDAIESRTGLIGHLLEGFGDDGLWYEGENYHLFALRGLLTGLSWARYMGADIMEDADLAAHVHLALRAPMLTALPDLTFPARKDARFGVSLAQPMYAELWETGRAWSRDEERERLERWLVSLYGAPAPGPATFDSWLHEAGEEGAGKGRTGLSWWMLLEMLPDPPGGEPWEGETVLLPSQGFAILREGQRYAGIEAGPTGGGHGHPDRLNLIVHAAGRYWLPDLGTGSYVSPDLFWYRSSLSHNAPRLDGRSQESGRASCEMFDMQDGWSWVRGRFGEMTRTVIAAPEYLLDIVELAAELPHVLELPWHLMGDVTAPGSRGPAEINSEFARDAERLVGGEAGGGVRLDAEADGAHARLILSGGEVLRAVGPGIPGGPPAPFFVQRGEGRHVRFVNVIGLDPAQPVAALRTDGDVVEVDLPSGTDRHAPQALGWQVSRANKTWRLGGPLPDQGPIQTLFSRTVTQVSEAQVPWVSDPPPLDGTMEGFPGTVRIALDHDDQYRRTEDPWEGPGEFSAGAELAWNEGGLYAAVDVRKPELVFRPPDDTPLGLDNETDDINSDGLQVYVTIDDITRGWLVVPDVSADSLRVQPVSGMDTPGVSLEGRWSATDVGYRVTMALRPEDIEFGHGERLGFELVVNEMREGRARRAGQLVWTGRGGWAYLRGDREDPANFGTLELV